MALLSLLFAVVAALHVVHAAKGLDKARCVACTVAVEKLQTSLDKTKKDLETSKEFNDKKAQKVDKVQKAQTKRWLKNEYRVALRAGIEDEFESVCSTDKLAARKELKQACVELLDEQEEDMPRAVLDGKGEGFCADVVPGCEGEAAVNASASFDRTLKSEPDSKAGSLKNGTVKRLISSAFNKQMKLTNGNVLVMLFTPSAIAKGKPYATLAQEFYNLAKNVNATKPAAVWFTQMNMAKNDFPLDVDLADPTGVQFALFLAADKASLSPKLLPEVGEKKLKGTDAKAVRDRLVQFLLTWLKEGDGRILRTIVKKMDDLQTKMDEMIKTTMGGFATGKASDAPDALATGKAKLAALQAAGDSVTEPPEGSDASAAAKPAAAKAAPRRRASESAAELLRRRVEECDICQLMVDHMGTALAEKKEELQLSHEANQKREAAVDKVQKAQTKRWLKNEYRVGLAAAVEDALESACDVTFEATCPTSEPPAHPELAWKTSKGAALPKDECSARAKGRCRSVYEHHAEPLTRATLDGKGPAVCAALLPKCKSALSQALGLGNATASEPAVFEEADADACLDSKTSCAAWASKGECESNSAYMAATCCKSCAARAAATTMQPAAKDEV